MKAANLDYAGTSPRSEYCLCQRVKPVSDPKTPFSSEAGQQFANHVVLVQVHPRVQA